MSGFYMDNSVIPTEMDRGGGELRRYMFAIELNGTIGTKAEKEGESETSNTHIWNPENSSSMYKKIPSGNDEYDAIRQTLVVRRAILGPSAKEGESNWVRVEVTDPDGSDTSFPLAYLCKGKEHQVMLDVVFPDARDVRVKFSLEEGTGPVHLFGYHLIERIQFDRQEDDECEEEEAIEDDEIAEEETAKLITQTRAIRAKRRINGENGNGELGVGVAKKLKTEEKDEGMEEEEAPTNGDASNELNA